MKEGIRSQPVYGVSQKTKAIINKQSNYYRSLILEENNKEKYSTRRPEQIINHSCISYGATLEGRLRSVKDILKSTSKLPVPISPGNGVYMIPTASMKNKDCAWLTYHHIDDYEQRDDKLFVAFRDGTGIYVNTSESTFDSQYKRTGQVIVHMNRGILFGGSHNWW